MSEEEELEILKVNGDGNSSVQEYSLNNFEEVHVNIGLSKEYTPSIYGETDQFPKITLKIVITKYAIFMLRCNEFVPFEQKKVNDLTNYQYRQFPTDGCMADLEFDIDGGYSYYNLYLSGFTTDTRDHVHRRFICKIKYTAKTGFVVKDNMEIKHKFDIRKRSMFLPKLKRDDMVPLNAQQSPDYLFHLRMKENRRLSKMSPPTSYVIPERVRNFLGI